MRSYGYSLVWKPIPLPNMSLCLSTLWNPINSNHSVVQIPYLISGTGIIQYETKGLFLSFFWIRQLFAWVFLSHTDRLSVIVFVPLMCLADSIVKPKEPNESTPSFPINGIIHHQQNEKYGRWMKFSRCIVVLYIIQASVMMHIQHQCILLVAAKIAIFWCISSPDMPVEGIYLL